MCRIKQAAPLSFLPSYQVPKHGNPVCFQLTQAGLQKIISKGLGP